MNETSTKEKHGAAYYMARADKWRAVCWKKGGVPVTHFRDSEEAARALVETFAQRQTRKEVNDAY